MLKNVAGQFVVLLAIDTALNLPKTGDAANITAYVAKDGDTTPDALADTSATELSNTNAKGLYQFSVAQGESNFNDAVFSGKSTTSGVEIVPLYISSQPATWHAMMALIQSIYDYITHPFWSLFRIYTRLDAGVPSTEQVDKAGYSVSQASRDDIVDAMHDEPLSGHTTAGTHGKGVADAASEAAAANTKAGTIQTQTNKMTWTNTGGVDYLQVDAQRMNAAEIFGDGSSGNKWRGA